MELGCGSWVWRLKLRGGERGKNKTGYDISVGRDHGCEKFLISATAPDGYEKILISVIALDVCLG